ncbi:MAG: HAD family phosphatase [Bacteroidetes bacterium]|nr:HAD family phosphatase [Bacteroidota bacterium]
MRIILFDLGGVLIELQGIADLLEWTGEGMTPETIWHMWLTSPAVRAFEAGAIGPDDFASRLVRELGMPVAPERFIEAFTMWPVGLYPGAADLLRRIPSGYVRAMLSNTNILHWPRFMEEMGIDGLFEHHFASHLIGKLKPDPGVFEHVVATLQCRPADVLFLDDQPLNVEAATAAGLHAVQVRGPHEAERVLIEMGVLAAEA